MKIKLQEYNELTDFRNYEPLTPLQAIKLKCKECCSFNSREAKSCKIYTCPLQQFINRKQQYTITEEERQRRKNIFNKQQCQNNQQKNLDID